MTEGPGKWVDKDAFVLPIIPEDLGLDPHFAALLHTTAFLELSGDEAVDPDWAVEALEHVAHYIQRLSRPEVERLTEQLRRVLDFGRQQQWPEEVVAFIADFFEAYGAESSE